MEFTDWKIKSCKKSRRVRSWYLYEQFKSLEKNQLDAAKKLKDRSFQERVLHQELNERRSRRRLCDQFGLCQSESGFGRNREPSKTLLSTSTDDFYESFCKLHNDEGDIFSCDDSQSSKTYQECRVTYNDELSNVESVASVVQNFTYDDNLTDNVKEDLQSVRRNINLAEDINLQLETVKENLECIEKYTKMCDEGQISEDESFDAGDILQKKNLPEKRFKTEDKSKVASLFSFWAKLVHFSYRTMQFNCGNCYNDYGTQLLVAILACDMLRRGLNKMCYVLQPFVSPVKFSPSEPEFDTKIYKNEKYRNYKKRKSFIKYLPLTYQNNAKTNTSECVPHCKHNNGIHKKMRGKSEPWRSVARLTKSAEKFEKCSSYWPDELKSGKSMCKCQQIKSMMNSMLQLSQQLDNVIREVESVHCS